MCTRAGEPVCSAAPGAEDSLHVAAGVVATDVTHAACCTLLLHLSVGAQAYLCRSGPQPPHTTVDAPPLPAPPESAASYPSAPSPSPPPILLAPCCTGVSVIGVSLPTMFQAREYRVLRALVFVALGLWGIVPVTHMTFLHWNTYAVRKAIVLDLCMGATYLVGWGGGGGGGCPMACMLVGQTMSFWIVCLGLVSYLRTPYVHEQ